MPDTTSTSSRSDPGQTGMVNFDCRLPAEAVGVGGDVRHQLALEPRHEEVAAHPRAGGAGGGGDGGRVLHLGEQVVGGQPELERERERRAEQPHLERLRLGGRGERELRQVRRDVRRAAVERLLQQRPPRQRRDAALVGEHQRAAALDEREQLERVARALAALAAQLQLAEVRLWRGEQRAQLRAEAVGLAAVQLHAQLARQVAQPLALVELARVEAQQARAHHREHRAHLRARHHRPAAWAAGAGAAGASISGARRGAS